MSDAESTAGNDFVRQIIRADLEAGKNDGRVHTRFPPEPNGYLHIGHAKAICLNFGAARDFQGLCNLRFDDTNPAKEETEYVEAIQEDIRWLGWDWEDRLYFASDYFPQLWEWAIHLVKKGKAYVDSLTSEEIREYRGSLTEPGRESPYRNRSVDENLGLLEQMKNGELEEGACVLRAKVDMTHANVLMRDPAMYRVKKETHHRTGTTWNVYPMYDFAHGLSDSIEGITHSLCSLEFENHRPLYDWFNENCPIPSVPRQYEFARLSLEYTIVSKRKLIRLVDEGHVDGWDDPRMPTIRGLRRRGYTPAALRNFCEKVGVARNISRTEMALLESCVREDLNRVALRVMGVLDPIKLVIENWPEGQVEELDAINNPEDESAGSRKIPFSGELWIERADFMEDPPRKYFRLGPDREVRLRWGYFVTCTGFDKDDAGTVTCIRCTYDPETLGGNAPDGRKVKGTIHWVSVAHALDAEVRLYDLLFTKADPEEGGDFVQNLNPDSLKAITCAKVEPSLAAAAADIPYQFERTGYFCLDSKESADGSLVFNRTVGLRDSWAKAKKKQGGQQKKKERRPPPPRPS
ncbi:MAG: glutamine--tRNA ligase [Planctomycetes bacterium]|nr:glutamine--tRNA ligase [Planctomycetota bacterium]